MNSLTTGSRFIAAKTSRSDSFHSRSPRRAVVNKQGNGASITCKISQHQLYLNDETIIFSCILSH
ncbi:MAG TPA: hypothetical protein VG101_16165, partial [Puia sp.]|nr:hypothetical protein [Puia sp.]